MLSNTAFLCWQRETTVVVNHDSFYIYKMFSFGSFFKLIYSFVFISFNYCSTIIWGFNQGQVFFFLLVSLLVLSHVCEHRLNKGNISLYDISKSSYSLQKDYKHLFEHPKCIAGWLLDLLLIWIGLYRKRGVTWLLFSFPPVFVHSNLVPGNGSRVTARCVKTSCSGCVQPHCMALRRRRHP